VDLKRFFKKCFKNCKRLGLPVKAAQVAQDVTQVAQDVENKFKYFLKNEQNVKVNPLPFCWI